MALFLVATAGRALIFWRQLRRQCLWHGPHCRPEFHAPLPPQRFCAYAPCGVLLNRDAPADRKYCKRTHQIKARRQRSAPRRKLEAAWALNSTYEDHAASCARKTANGGAYDTLGDAMHALSWLRERSRDDDDRSIYKCLCCDKFHITSHAGRAAG